jgi:hypothetical protein
LIIATSKDLRQLHHAANLKMKYMYAYILAHPIHSHIFYARDIRKGFCPRLQGSPTSISQPNSLDAWLTMAQ